MGFVQSICLAAVAAALFRMLVPQGKLSKQVSVLVVSVFLLSGLSALRGVSLDLSQEDFAAEYSAQSRDLTGEVNASLQKKICGEMSDKLYALLGENGLHPAQIHVNVNISGLYSISITQVKLVFAAGQESEAQQAYELVRKQLPKEIDVVASTKQR